MNYGIDPDTGLFYIFWHGFHLFCISESKILSMLHLVHDQAGYWEKQGTLAKF